MNRKNEIERFGDVLRQGGQLSVFVLKASVGKEIERLALSLIHISEPTRH